VLPETILSVKRFSNIILVCVFFAAIFVADVNAQPAVNQSAEGGVVAPVTVPVKAGAAVPVVPQIAPTVFRIGWFPVTNSMICSWIVAVVILIVVRLSTVHMKEVPSGPQNVMELLIEGWENLAGGVLEPKVARWVFPFATTFFIFIVLSNLIDLIPGVGSIGFGIPDKMSSLPFGIVHAETPFFRPPTSDANLTIAMAAIYFVMSSYWALIYNGPVGLVKHIFGVKMKTNKWLFAPLLLLFIFIGLTETISILIVRPVALAMRLYGNIFGGETLLTMMLTHKPVWMAVLSAVPFYFFELLVCLLQAFVFAMLTIAFVGTLCTHADEENGH
jgi:F-type H+-transporting ATPase subunit a